MQHGFEKSMRAIVDEFAIKIIVVPRQEGQGYMDRGMPT